MAESTRRGAVGQFFRGLRYALSGLATVMFRPGLWPYVLGPTLVTLTLFVAGAWGAWALVGWLFEQVFAPPAEGAPSVVWTLVSLWVRLWAIALLGVGLYFTSNIVATPFNDWLSQRVETLRLGPYTEPFSWATMFGDLAQSLWHSILSLFLLFAIFVGTLALSLIPLIGTLGAPIISFVATALLIGRESMDGCQSRRRMSFAHKMLFLRHHWPVLLGFGVLGAAVVWIPLVNLLVVPLSIAGGTMLYCDLEREGLVPHADGRPGFRLNRARDARLADPAMGE
jgi:CysZ protein